MIRIFFDDFELFLKLMGRYGDVKFVDIWDLLKFNFVNKLYDIIIICILFIIYFICLVNKKGDLLYCVYIFN